MSTNKLCVTRLQKEYVALCKNQDIKDAFTAKPSSSNILEWHYVIFGPPNTPYQGGFYHGQIIFPIEYPHKAPSILMTTPSGRFICNTRICTSNSDFHNSEWSPSWSISTILLGLISFMAEDEVGIGSIVKSKQTRQQYAAASMAFNLKNPIFVKLFPEIINSYKKLGEPSSSSSSLQPKTTTTTTTTTTNTPTTTTTSSSSSSKNLKETIATTNKKPDTIAKNNNNNNNNNSIKLISILIIIISIFLYFLFK